MVAAAVHETSRDKLPIYPASQPDVLLLETPSELEQRIGVARRAVTATYLDARAQVQGVISRWISVEQSVEHRVKSLIAPDEPLTPGLLYVGVATLTGSVFARNRSLATRALLPPTLLVLALNHFLPKTTHNVAQYFGALEDAHFPTFAEKHEIAKAHSAMTWERVKDATQNGRAAMQAAVEGAVVRVEEATGLKLKEALARSEGVVRAVETQAIAVAHSAQAQVEAATDVVSHKVEEAKEAAEQKAAAVTGAAEKIAQKADEPPRRLV